MRRSRFSRLMVPLLLAALAASGALAASFARHTDLSDWSLGRFTPPADDAWPAPPAEPGTSPAADFAGADAPGPAPRRAVDRLALRIGHVDVRGPWPLSALLQGAFDVIPTVGSGVTVFLVLDSDETGRVEAFAGLAAPPRRDDMTDSVYAPWGYPEVVGAVGGRIDCDAGGGPGAERCIGLEAQDARGLVAIFRDGASKGLARLSFGARAIVAAGDDPEDDLPFHRIRAEVWLPATELRYLPSGARQAAEMALLGPPNRDTDGDGASDAYTFHLEARGEPIDLRGAPRTNLRLLDAWTRRPTACGRPHCIVP